jgi:hypothetical protein
MVNVSVLFIVLVMALCEVNDGCFICFEGGAATFLPVERLLDYSLDSCSIWMKIGDVMTI